MNKIQVCSKYCGTTIILAEFNTQEEADKFMKLPYVMFYADELLNGEDDEVIYPCDMWSEEALPFTEPIKFVTSEEDEYLPF